MEGHVLPFTAPGETPFIRPLLPRTETDMVFHTTSALGNVPVFNPLRRGIWQSITTPLLVCTTKHQSPCAKKTGLRERWQWARRIAIAIATTDYVVLMPTSGGWSNSGRDTTSARLSLDCRRRNGFSAFLLLSLPVQCYPGRGHSARSYAKQRAKIYLKFLTANPDTEFHESP
ncbi:uncharacterized protein BJX67DRAFT_37750 [Aspergillus lucknowensis]|uniref:Uncharacterized protein n=1 Tax=Aspergillus lucknowensis TaxID=176173 RepID=A0ABR4LWE7_9EURO